MGMVQVGHVDGLPALTGSGRKCWFSAVFWRESNQCFQQNRHCMWEEDRKLRLLPLSNWKRRFAIHWEVENYRRNRWQWTFSFGPHWVWRVQVRMLNRLLNAWVCNSGKRHWRKRTMGELSVARCYLMPRDSIKRWMWQQGTNAALSLVH